MSEIQENTEAKLAAYIDGEMDPADRAEIERLIEQNPNYRRVLEQLRQTRDLLRALPRESAPPELTEAFNGQLERSVLLDSLGEPRKSALSLSRWPQWMMAAAIVLLTIGLGIVVYLMLPRGKPTVSVASVGSSQQVDAQDRNDAKTPQFSRLGNKTDQNDESEHEEPETTGPHQETSNAIEGMAAKDRAPSDASDVTDLAQNVYQNPEVQTLLNRDQVKQEGVRDEAPGALVLVVRSNDPQQLQKDVSSYFTTNNISWIAAPEEVPATVNRSLSRRAGNTAVDDGRQQSQWQQLLASSRSALQQITGQGNASANASANSTAQSSQPSANGSQSAQGAPTTNSANFANSAYAAAGMRQDSAPSASVQNQQQANPRRSARAAASGGSGGSLGGAAGLSQAKSNEQSNATLNGAHGPATEPANLPLPSVAPAPAPAPTSEPAFAPVDNVLVARQVSRRQVQQLNEELASRGGQVRQTELLVGGEVKELSQSGALATEPAGATAAQNLRDSLSRMGDNAFRDRPTTRSSESENNDTLARKRAAQEVQEPTTRPSSYGALSASATRPAPAAGDAPDQPIDLVIVLRKAPVPTTTTSGAPTTQPTTQPAGQP